MSTALDAAFLDHALDVALRAARGAGERINRYFRQGVAVEVKPDATPVTIADREAEDGIRDTLLAAFPDHAIYGEERGRTGAGDFLWLVDPLDGTKSFVRGTPFFSTQIALMHAGELVLGVSMHRCMARPCGRRGGGAFLDGSRVHVAATPSLRDAALSIGNIKTLDPRHGALERIRHAGWRSQSRTRLRRFLPLPPVGPGSASTWWSNSTSTSSTSRRWPSSRMKRAARSSLTRHGGALTFARPPACWLRCRPCTGNCAGGCERCVAMFADSRRCLTNLGFLRRV